MSVTLHEPPVAAPPATPVSGSDVVRLRRGALSLWETITSTLANLAPAEGIFLAITLVVMGMGSRAPWAFLIAGVAILAAGNTMAEFAKEMPSAGSFITFIGNGFGVKSRKAGTFLAGVTVYLAFICYPICIAAVVVFLGSWVASLMGWTQSWAWLLITLLSIAAVTPLLLRGRDLHLGVVRVLCNRGVWSCGALDHRPLRGSREHRRSFP